MRTLFAITLALLLQSHLLHADWQAATTKVDITPEKAMWMAGYASRSKPGEGSTTRLYAKILLLQDATGERMVFVTLDLIGVPRILRIELEKEVMKRFQLGPESLLINASHTHSGPMIRTIPPFKEGQPERPAYDRIPEAEAARYVAMANQYRIELIASLVSSIGTCMKNLEPVQLLFSEARCGFAMNRRLPTERGFINSPNPEGPVDHAVPVLQVRDPNKQLKAILFGYACHSTVLSLMTFSGDYPGWAQQYLEEDHPGCIAMFITGCGGDQNPYPRREAMWAPRHGRTLANAVETGLIANPSTIKGDLKASFTRIALPYGTPPTRQQLLNKARSTDRYDKRHAESLLEYWDAKGGLPTTYPYPIQVVRVGNGFSMVALGGEVVVDYSLRLKKELEKGPIWVAGYSNDVMGYIPSKRVLNEGGYEGETSMRYVRAVPHPGKWASEIEELIVAKVKQLHEGVH